MREIENFHSLYYTESHVFTTPVIFKTRETNYTGEYNPHSMKIISDILNIITNISWAADLSATIVAMVIGYIWYHSSVFGTVWVRVANLSTESINSLQAKYNVLYMFPITFIIAANIAAFCKHLKYTDPARALLIGYDLGLIACLLLAVHFIYEQRNFTHYIITAGYILVSMSAMGLVIGVVL
jgi:Protein of unknown function (DUF1761)